MASIYDSNLQHKQHLMDTISSCHMIHNKKNQVQTFVNIAPTTILQFNIEPDHVDVDDVGVWRRIMMLSNNDEEIRK